MAIRMKVLFLLAIFAVTHAQDVYVPPDYVTIEPPLPTPTPEIMGGSPDSASDLQPVTIESPPPGVVDPTPVVDPVPVGDPTPIGYPVPVEYPTPVGYPAPVEYPAPVGDPAPVVDPVPIGGPGPIPAEGPNPVEPPTETPIVAQPYYYPVESITDGPGTTESISTVIEEAPTEAPKNNLPYAPRSFLRRPPPGDVIFPCLSEPITETVTEPVTEPPITEPPEEPPAFPTCGENEIFETLPFLCNPEDTTCEMYFRGEQRSCIPGRFCDARCRCLPGFVRNKSGVCVMPQQCCEDPNSEMIAGPNNCPGGTCANPNFTPCDNPWVPFGCQCKPGFVKLCEENPVCVPIESCYLYLPRP